MSRHIAIDRANKQSFHCDLKPAGQQDAVRKHKRQLFVERMTNKTIMRKKETRTDDNGFIAWHSADHAGAVYYRMKNQARARDDTRTLYISPTFLFNGNTKCIQILFSYTKLDCSSSLFERC